MKKIYSNWLGMSLAAALLMGTAACSDDNEKTSPIFPSEVTSLTGIAANTQQQLSFEANMPWQLSSDATWCTFVADGFNDLNTINGEAGKQMVMLNISDANQKFDRSSKANLTLTMGEESHVIATVERAPKGYVLTIVNAEKQVVDTLKLEYQKDLEVVVRANFNYSYSELEMVDIVRNDSVFTLTVKKGFEKNAIEGMNISLIDETGNFNKVVPVIYEGMDVNAIDITKPQGYSCWNWTVSTDGQKMSQVSGVSGSNEAEGALTFNIKARNDDYDFLYMEEYNGKWYAGAQWMHVQHNGEEASLTFDANESANDRNGYVLAFPRAQFDSLDDTFQKWTSNGTDESFADAYANNVIFQGKQNKAANQGGSTGEACMTVTNGTTMAEVTVSAVTGDYKDYFMSEYNVSEANLAAITVPAGTPLTINPMMPNLANMMAFDSNLSSINDIYMEASMDEKENMVIMTRVPEGATGFIYLVFQGLAEDGESMVNEKVLLINIGEGGNEGQGSTGDMADFNVKNGRTYEDLSVSAVTGDYLEFFMSEYSLEANQMAAVTVEKGTPLVIYPSMADLGDIVVNDINGKRSDIVPEMAEDWEGNLYAMVVCPTDNTEFFYVVFKDANMVNKKLLLVNIAQ